MRLRDPVPNGTIGLATLMPDLHQWPTAGAQAGAETRQR